MRCSGGSCPQTRNYYANNLLRMTFRNFDSIFPSRSSEKEGLFFKGITREFIVDAKKLLRTFHMLNVVSQGV